MSVENFDQLGGAIEFLGEGAPENCFYCGKPLAGLTAFWHGLDRGKSIGLHPSCAVEFGARISRDGLNARYLSEGHRASIGIAVGITADN